MDFEKFVEDNLEQPTEEIVNEESPSEPVEENLIEPEVKSEPEPEPEPEPEEPTVEEPAKPSTVPLSALQEERRKRQELQEELEQLRSSQKVEEPKPVEKEPTTLDPRDPDPYDKMDDDDIPTKAEQKAHEEWLQRENQRQSYKRQQETAWSLEQQARQRFTAEAMGQTLDYDTVVKGGIGFLTDQDRAAVISSPDPASKFYDLCLARNPFAPKPKEAPQPPKKDVATPPVKLSVESAPKLSEVFRDENQTPAQRLANSFIGED